MFTSAPCLTTSDREFFGLCDGIFLNYWWTPESMLSSKNRAGSRLRDVYVGVDVFGRGTRDGGGFNVVQVRGRVVLDS